MMFFIIFNVFFCESHKGDATLPNVSGIIGIEKFGTDSESFR